MTRQSVAFLGCGFAFPLRVDPDTGGFAGVKNAENVKASIRMFLSTVQGERILNEAYGMPSVLFEPLSVGTEDIIKHAVVQGLARFEPRVSVVSVTVTAVTRAATEGGLSGIRVEIVYRVRSSGDLDSVVWTNTQTEEAEVY